MDLIFACRGSALGADSAWADALGKIATRTDWDVRGAGAVAFRSWLFLLRRRSQ